MTVETAIYINTLDATLPTGSDPKSESDNHHRTIKSAVKATFPNIAGVVTPTHAELNYVAGVTSGIQAQIAAEATTRLASDGLLAPLVSPALVGTPTAPTAAASTITNQIANTAFVSVAVGNAGLSAGALPWVTGSTYAIGARVTSVANGRVYMSLAAGVSNTDPASDTRWLLVTTNRPAIAISTTTVTAVSGTHYVMYNAAQSTLTLPASPVTGSIVQVTFTNARTDNVIARNGSALLLDSAGNPLLEDMTVDVLNRSVILEYAYNAWRFYLDSTLVANASPVLLDTINSVTSAATAAETSSATALTRSAAAALSEYNAGQSALTAKHIYAGTYTSDPLTRPDGTARQVGDSAFINGLERRFNGSTWQASDISTANLAASTGAGLVGFVQAGTGAVARTLQDKNREVASDADFSSLQAAVTAMAGKKLRINNSYVLTAPIILSAGIEIEFSAGAVISSADPTISLFSATGQTGIKIRNGYFKYTAGGSTGLIGGVFLDTCTHCLVEFCTFEGMQFSSVHLTNSDLCVVRNNKIFGTLSTHSDSNDICVYNNSSDNLIEKNKCLGTGSHGILVQGPGATTPMRNIVSKNKITAKLAYGVVVYQVTTGNSETVVDGNDIRDIDGALFSGTSGHGIYIQTSGGCRVTNNRVQNCNISTTVDNALPAGISIALASGDLLATVVTGNRLIGGKYSSIAISDVGKGVISDNVMLMAAGTGVGIRATNCSGVVIANNKIKIPTGISRTGLLCIATTSNMKNMVVSGNVVEGGNSVLFNVTQTGGFTISGVFSNNSSISNESGAQAMVFNSVVDSSIVGNYAEGYTAGLYIQGCQRIRGSGNTARSASVNKFLSGGACVDVHFDVSNNFDMTNTGSIQNTATGCTITQRNNATPAVGNWAIGDRIEQSVPVVGSPKGWRCTVAGLPGTWVSEGNL